MTVPSTPGGALGIVESVGLVGALEAAGAMVKSANVVVTSYKTMRNGQVHLRPGRESNEILKFMQRVL